MGGIGTKHGTRAGQVIVDTDTPPTREVLYIFPEAATVAAVTAGDYAVAIAAVGNTHALSGYFPWDFTAILSISLVYIGGGIATTLQIDTDWASATEPFNIHSDVIAGLYPSTAMVIEELDLTPAFDAAPVTAGDYFGVTVTHISDDPAHLMGVRLRYR